jgi:hypothetical protein
MSLDDTLLNFSFQRRHTQSVVIITLFVRFDKQLSAPALMTRVLFLPRLIFFALVMSCRHMIKQGAARGAEV